MMFPHPFLLMANIGEVLELALKQVNIVSLINKGAGLYLPLPA
jgi:hypothetical protein